MKLIRWIALFVVGLFSLAVPNSFVQPQGEAQTTPGTRGQAILRLQASLTGRGRLKRDRATGLIDFVKLDREVTGSLAAARETTSTGKSLAFLREQGQAFGLAVSDSQLTLATEQRDPHGGVHLTFNQIYQGVPVFAGVIKTHFNSAGDLRVVNGVVVPDIELNPIPSRTAEEAAAVALAKVKGDSPQASGLTVTGSKLYVYRTGLAQGVAGQNHLAWEIEVSNGANIHEFVYIDAHTGKFIDQLTGLYDALSRRVYDGENIVQYPPPSYPSDPFWVEGQQFPTGVAGADEIIAATRETYDLFHNALGRDSFDNAGSTMDSIFNSGVEPGNAHANPLGQLTSYGMYFVADDVVAHEWTHVYTYFTNGLIYAWQPGALNEAYSDIIGETVDLQNGRGLDSPGGLRQNDSCAYRVPSPVLRVNSPAYLQRDYTMGPALFGPPFSAAGVTANIVPVNDGVGSRTDGCQTPFRNATQLRGNIALIDRSQPETSPCGYAQRVKNAQLNGAVAVLIANDAAAGDIPAAMFDFDPSITIPSGRIGYSDGQALRDPRARTVNATIRGGEESGNNSQRWHLGEDTEIRGFRDMWNPPCYENPAKTSDRQYFCGTIDNGGVHFNSGIPNHAYALLVDGGTFNGQSIQPLGLTKAAHIYLRAMLLYHTPTSDFADHAEALEASAADLIGVDLSDLLTGQPSGQVISAVDVEQVHRATLAVELREPPEQCGFHPLLAKTPPSDTCPSQQNTEVTLFSDVFESDPTSQWEISSEPGSPATFLPRDWTWVHQLPDGRPGSGFFAIDPLDDCLSAPPGQAGVLHLESPAISLPRVMLGGPHLSFDHWVATEAGYDGGQLMISVNDGPFILVAPSAFLYNGYNTTLFPAVPGYEYLFNPRAGQPAFSGADGGILKGSWGTSIIDLTLYARSGDRIKLRWDLSTDYCYGTSLGWYVDNVRVYACRP
jgi:Zn-dependent metalloprotease